MIMMMVANIVKLAEFCRVCCNFAKNNHQSRFLIDPILEMQLDYGSDDAGSEISSQTQQLPIIIMIITISLHCNNPNDTLLI